MGGTVFKKIHRKFNVSLLFTMEFWLNEYDRLKCCTTSHISPSFFPPSLLLALRGASSKRKKSSIHCRSASQEVLSTVKEESQEERRAQSLEKLENIDDTGASCTSRLRRVLPFYTHLKILQFNQKKCILSLFSAYHSKHAWCCYF